jgi:hypothetical protein
MEAKLDSKRKRNDEDESKFEDDKDVHSHKHAKIHDDDSHTVSPTSSKSVISEKLEDGEPYLKIEEDILSRWDEISELLSKENLLWWEESQSHTCLLSLDK